MLGVIFISGCTGESTTSLQGPKNYTDNFISFTYPGDWNLTLTKDSNAGGNYVGVENPNTGAALSISNPIKNSAYNAYQYTKQAEAKHFQVTDVGRVKVANSTGYSYIRYNSDGVLKTIFFDIKQGVSMAIYLSADDNSTFENSKENFDKIIKSLTVNKDFDITFT